MNRLTNYTFGLIVIYLFILEGNAGDHIMILLGLFLSLVAAYTAFFGNLVTLDATRAIVVLGTITLGFGGWWIAFAMIFFFFSSSLLTKLRVRISGLDKEKLHVHHDLQSRRDSYQVWANGFWVAFFLVIWFLTNEYATLLAAFAVLATAAADTWSTEIGSIRPGKTYRITTMKEVKPGTDGGVSVKGTIAAFLGSISIAIFLVPFYPEPITALLIVFVAGFLGSVADSVLGAMLQKEEVKDAVPTDYFRNQSTFKNSVVNWIATGIGGFLAFIITQIYYL
ncbi:MAG: DUF92 domain-containing protein [Balneolaceae bacterium]|nr:DUF92 domain-containing protein [Balneolaceae bacterium]MCH8548642.1 DUF92 domain-containing protein [Balneolaceae bacterium]